MSIVAVEIQPIGPMAEWSIAVASKPILSWVRILLGSHDKCK